MSDQSVRIHTYLRCCIGDTTERCDQCMGEKRDCELGMAEARSIEHYTLALEAVAEAAREVDTAFTSIDPERQAILKQRHCRALDHLADALSALDEKEGK
jgi:hypothetical protein